MAEGSDPAVDVAALEVDIWREVVVRSLTVGALDAVEAEGLGGLVVFAADRRVGRGRGQGRPTRRGTLADPGEDAWMAGKPVAGE